MLGGLSWTLPFLTLVLAAIRQTCPSPFYCFVPLCACAASRSMFITLVCLSSDEFAAASKFGRLKGLLMPPPKAVTLRPHVQGQPSEHEDRAVSRGAKEGRE
ncbi:hypothetical protein R3P38DRAFT_1650880 [Favolaschia claudopus]|uniref:Secreted protein n=1 Tax=Favolaschia claudopus TaxID=2862362 RepID=A0AAW0DNP7_9AGAR